MGKKGGKEGKLWVKEGETFFPGSVWKRDGNPSGLPNRFISISDN